jgi:hypothetical protein
VECTRPSTATLAVIRSSVACQYAELSSDEDIAVLETLVSDLDLGNSAFINLIWSNFVYVHRESHGLHR